jgi:hypothetical protein
VKDDTIYDVYAQYCGLVDRENQDYHNFSAFSHSKHANTFLLHSVCVYALLAARAVWEEQRRVHARSSAGGARSAVAAIKSEPYPRFIVDLALSQPRHPTGGRKPR